ncbi:c-type cytochrome [Roseivirga sp.]|uniref:c-type cytochrome n=1 Tax=Roseivirga sp. TaxID=1964215 RepID=UPI003B52BBC3
MRSKRNFLAALTFLVVSTLSFNSCSERKKSDGAKVQERLNNTEIKYFTNGRKLYTQHCSNCHMENGEGLGRLIPPLKDSDYLLEDIGRSARLIVNGIAEPILVNDVQFQQPMPGVSSLNYSEVTEILTYITNAWGNEYGGINPEDIKEALKKN